MLKKLKIHSILLLIMIMFLLQYVTSVSAQEQDLTPTMTSNTTPSGMVSASSVYSTYGPWLAFDKRSTGDGYYWIANASTGWIRYDFGSSTAIVTKYSITSKDHEAYASQSPKSWIFEGSNDGVSWTALDSQTNVTSWSRDETRSYTISNNTPYKMYQIRVEENFGGGYLSIQEIALYGHNTPIIPSTPTNVIATAGNGEVSLSWTGSTDSDGTVVNYNIYRNGTLIASPTNASYVDTGLTNGTTYSYTVSAVDNDGNESDKSAVVSVTPKNMTPPVSPSGFTGVAGNETVDLNWTANKEIDINGYYVYQNGVKVNTTPIASNNFKVTGLNIGETYSFQVSAVNTSGYESIKSEIVYVTPLAPLAAVPSGLAATPGDKTVSLTWNMVTRATGYNIKRSTTANGPYTIVANNVYNSPFTDNTVSNGTTYYYVVSALNSGGESGNSNEVSVTPQAQLESVLDVVITEENVSIGQEFIANIAMKNVENIYAEDFTMKYDNTLFEYLGFEEVPGYKIYNQPTDQNGVLRFIVASQGKNYGINGEKVFLKLKFRAKAAGTGKIDLLKCRIANTDKEFDLSEESCLEDLVTVEGVKDVNRSGEYTLLDLSIDAYHYGEPASNVDPSKYDANQAGDEFITDDDLIYIVNQMLLNTNYSPSISI